MIESYFLEQLGIIGDFNIVIRSEIQKRKINETIGIFNGKLYFNVGILEFSEVIRITDKEQIDKKKYKYHFRYKNNKMIFRYDNVPHHKEIKTFPHHKHLQDKVVESQEINLYDILLEIREIIQK